MESSKSFLSVRAMIDLFENYRPQVENSAVKLNRPLSKSFSALSNLDRKQSTRYRDIENTTQEVEYRIRTLVTEVERYKVYSRSAHISLQDELLRILVDLSNIDASIKEATFFKKRKNLLVILRTQAEHLNNKLPVVTGIRSNELKYVPFSKFENNEVSRFNNNISSETISSKVASPTYLSQNSVVEGPFSNTERSPLVKKGSTENLCSKDRNGLSEKINNGKKDYPLPKENSNFFLKSSCLIANEISRIRKISGSEENVPSVFRGANKDSHQSTSSLLRNNSVKSSVPEENSIISNNDDVSDKFSIPQTKRGHSFDFSVAEPQKHKVLTSSKSLDENVIINDANNNAQINVNYLKNLFESKSPLEETQNRQSSVVKKIISNRGESDRDDKIQLENDIDEKGDFFVENAIKSDDASSTKAERGSEGNLDADEHCSVSSEYSVYVDSLD